MSRQEINDKDSLPELTNALHKYFLQNNIQDKDIRLYIEYALFLVLYFNEQLQKKRLFRGEKTYTCHKNQGLWRKTIRFFARNLNLLSKESQTCYVIMKRLKEIKYKIFDYEKMSIEDKGNFDTYEKTFKQLKIQNAKTNTFLKLLRDNIKKDQDNNKYYEKYIQYVYQTLQNERKREKSATVIQSIVRGTQSRNKVNKKLVRLVKSIDSIMHDTSDIVLRQSSKIKNKNLLRRFEDIASEYVKLEDSNKPISIEKLKNIAREVKSINSKMTLSL